MRGAYFSRSPAFGRLLHRQMTIRDRALLVAAMSALGILGTYAGIPVGGALANSRLVGEMVAGLLGGPIVGLLVGLIAGVHRYMLGGFTALSCALAAVAIGVLGGAVQRRTGPASSPGRWRSWSGRQAR